jgi:hypothetical protein
MGIFFCIHPVFSRVIVDDIKDNPHLFFMRCFNEIDKILPAPEPGIHLEEILDTIPVIGILFIALPEYRAEPDRSYTEITEIREF